MTTNTVSPLRQRMIEDMNARKLCAGTQRGHSPGDRSDRYAETMPSNSARESRSVSVGPRQHHAGARFNRFFCWL
jgi:hypothetical protein